MDKKTKLSENASLEKILYLFHGAFSCFAISLYRIWNSRYNREDDTTICVRSCQ